MFRHRRQLRQWAARVLFLWLFGIVVGVAHACVVSGPSKLDGAEPGLASTGAMPMHGHGDPADIADHDHDESHHGGAAAKSNCQDFCDKASVSISPVKSGLDDAQSHAALPASTRTAIPVPALLPARQWLPRRDGVAAPPITLAFLRLTL